MLRGDRRGQGQGEREGDGMSKTGEFGPIYNVELIDELPLSGAITQAMPSRRDLDQVNEISSRVVAGYEVLLAHWHEQNKVIEKNLHDFKFKIGDVVEHKSSLYQRLVVVAQVARRDHPDSSVCKLYVCAHATGIGIEPFANMQFYEHELLAVTA